MKNVLTPALLATMVALPAFAQPLVPGDPTGGNMQQIPIESGEGPPTEDGQSIMPDGTTVSDPSTPASAASAGFVSGSNVRVRLPDGKLTEIPDSAETPWYRTDTMKGYTNYYFDPANGIYVVRGDNNPSNWPKKNWGVE